MFRKVMLASAIALATTQVQAAALFDISFEWDGRTYRVSGNNAQDIIKQVDVGNFEDRWSAYGFGNGNKDDLVKAKLIYRGVEINVDYTLNANGSETIVLRSDDLKLNKSFSNLDDLENELIEIGSDGRNLLRDINKLAVAKTGFDPVAGNPNSLMATMVGSIHGLTNTSITGTNRDDIDNQWDLGIRYGSQTVAGNDITSIHLPIAYTFKLDWFPGHRLQFRMPISHTEINGETNNYSLQFGFGWTIPLIEGLEITPAIDHGIAGSEELLTAGVLRALSLTTRYDFSVFGQNFTFTNSLAKIDSVNIEIDGDEDEDTGETRKIGIDYDLSNSAMTNGVAWHMALPWQKLAVQAYLRDTRFFGDKLYSSQSTELGVNFGWSASADTNTQFFVGASYQRHDKSEFDGARLNAGLTF